MTPLADYFHHRYLHHHKGIKVHADHGVQIQLPCVKVPKATITQMKLMCLGGIVAATFVPPQYAWAVIAVTNGYWMFKL